MLRMHRLTLAVLVLGAVGALSLGPGCGAGNEDAGTGGAGASASNGSSKSGQGGGFGEGGGGTCAGELTCAADLHTILCNGEVLGTCGADQGCAGGTCIPACDAANANKSSVGCDYYTVNPDVTFSQGACFAAFVANTWTTPAQLTVERDGQVLDVSAFARIPSGSGAAITYNPLPGGQVPPGEVAILFLAQFNPGALYTPACPAGVTTAVTAEDAALHGTGIAKSFHITSSVPVVAYDIFPYGGGPSAITSATLLLPTSAWDTNYIAIDPFRPQLVDPNFQQYIQVVAAEDNTAVTISPTAAIVGGTGVSPTGADVPATYTINRGQVLQFRQDASLTGSPLQATKPVGLLGGNGCMVIPDSGISACDAGHQMIPPVRALGTEYIGVHHRNRFPGVEEAPPWRIVGAVDGTQLTYEPAPPPGAPTTIGVGQVAEFITSAPFIVRSQDADHPFYVSGHMTGCTDVSVDLFGDCRGDPETVNVIPTEQYLDQYVFFTDPTYPETSLVVIRNAAADGFHDVTLGCLAAPITGWQPIGSSGQYEYAYLDLVTGNFQPMNGCDNGRHEALSDAPFAITVWGWGSGATGGDPSLLQFPYSQYVSYAYPAGASVQSLSQVVVPPDPR